MIVVKINDVEYEIVKLLVAKSSYWYEKIEKNW